MTWHEKHKLFSCAKREISLVDVLLLPLLFSPSWASSNVMLARLAKLHSEQKGNFEMTLSGDVKAQLWVKAEALLHSELLPVCSRTYNSRSPRGHDNQFSISKSLSWSCFQQAASGCLFLPSLEEPWFLAVGSLQSLCLVICTSPLGEERFGVTEAFPRRVFFFLGWKGLFSGVVSKGLLFLSAG